MYINPKQFAQAFREIKRTSLSHSTCKLVIYCSCLNIDALCGTKILSLIFKKQLIQYQLIPVVGYSDLQQHYSKLDDDVANVILIGCGAMIDIENFFDIDPDDYLINNENLTGNTGQNVEQSILSNNKKKKQKFKRKIYVIDGHRPWNLDNIFGSDLVVCFDDGHIDEDLQDEQKSYHKLLELQEQNEEADDNTDNENIETVNSDDDSEGEKEFEEELESNKDKKRMRDEVVSECESLLEQYYEQGTIVSSSLTAQIYSMLSTIGDFEIDNDTLWLTIVGTTSLDYMYPQVYNKIYPLLKDEVMRMSPSNLSISSSGNSKLQHYISMEKDYYLFLFRHWSLYNSFLYSNFVNSRLFLWREEGRKKLNKMFAKMGISLQTANQNWLYIDIEIKRKLNGIFKKHLGLYDLEELIRDGFIRHFGYQGSISAFEFSESLIALLQYNTSDIDGKANDHHYNNNENKNDLENNNTMDGDSNGGSQKNDGNTENTTDALLTNSEDINAKIQKKEKVWVSNFWKSWDALNNKPMKANTNVNGISLKNTMDLRYGPQASGIALINEGIEFAKEFQQIIFKTGSMILEKRMIKFLGTFKFIVMKEELIPNLRFFRNPLNLTRLGKWVLENLAELGFQKLLPLIIASLDSETDTYLVVGLPPVYPRNYDYEHQHQENGPRKKRKKNKSDSQNEENNKVDKKLLNTFNIAFQHVANTTGAKVRIDSFENSVIEIKKEDLTPFMENMTKAGFL